MRLSSSKSWRILPKDNTLTRLDIPAYLLALVNKLGISSQSDLDYFFNPSLQKLLSPWLMEDMAKAVDRIDKALLEGEKILLYGDYDVDGVTAVALLHVYLQKQYAQVGFYFPDRRKEGYGLTESGLQYAIENDYTLLLLLDCGTENNPLIEKAGEQGIDIIICDHHQPSSVLPPVVAILNPFLPNSKYPEKVLSSCGVAFKLCQAITEKLELDWRVLEDLLDLTALSIAADQVPVMGENRILARFGLEKINRLERIGIRTLITHSRYMPPLDLQDLAWSIAPLINAAGRLANASQALRLLITHDKRIANDYSLVLDTRNQQRRSTDQRMQKEANKLVEELLKEHSFSGITLYDPNWHNGVVGITATRLMEKYKLPTAIMAPLEDTIAGSARSPEGIDLHLVFEQCKDFLTNYGGHANAIGFSLLPEHMEGFKTAFEQACSQQFSTNGAPRYELEIVATLSLADIQVNLWEEIQRFSPFGHGNPQPLFHARNVKLWGNPQRLKSNHIHAYVMQDNEKARISTLFPTELHRRATSYGVFDICFYVRIHHFNDRKHIQLQVIDIRNKT